MYTYIYTPLYADMYLINWILCCLMRLNGRFQYSPASSYQTHIASNCWDRHVKLVPMGTGNIIESYRIIDEWFCHCEWQLRRFICSFTYVIDIYLYICLFIFSWLDCSISVLNFRGCCATRVIDEMSCCCPSHPQALGYRQFGKVCD